jgi:hypothetical protein
MAHALVNLESLRGALEVAEGDATTPTRLLYPGKGGGITIAQNVETIRDERAWNKGTSTANIYPGMQDVAVRLSNWAVTYEDVGWWLSLLCASGSGTPTTVDTTAFSRTFTPHQTNFTVGSAGTRSAHIQFSTSDFIGTRGWSVPGLVIEDLELIMKKRASGTDTGALLNATLRTASAATNITSFTGSLSDRAQTHVLGQQFKTYFDASTMGSTADANITEVTLRVNRPASFHDGMDNTALHSSMHRANGWTSQLSIVRKFSDATELDAYMGSNFAKTTRKVRTIAEGAVVGATTAKNTLRVDFVGKYTDKSEYGGQNVDGIWYQNLTLDGIYDSTLTADYEIFTQNSISAAYTTA